ncbi:hypothetical protein [Limnohabitans sp.]|jgi:hypothetical protein|uniref:hypothetical protein n=1 Tax=Limnohabitans sp. TaxID=1907725 RepID=UPI00333FE956
MPQKLEAELRKQLEDLYEPLAAANVAFHNSQSAEDKAVVQKFERQMNKLVDQLIALEDSPNA